MARNLEVHTGLLHYCTFWLKAADDAQNVRVDTARGKDNDQQTRIYQNWYCDVAAYIIKSRQMSEDTKYTVYKLMTDNLQLR